MNQGVREENQTHKNNETQKPKTKNRPTCSHLELNDALLTEAQVHALGVLHVEGALVQLRDWVVGIHEGRLLVHLPDDESGQRHARRGAHQLHR